MTGPPAGKEPVVELLGQQVQRLSTEVGGALRRVRMRYGDAVVEIEWQPNRVGPTASGGSPAATVPEPTGPGSAADRQVVAAPIIGTFYRASAPGEPPFVAVGDVIEAGQVIGIVEAMKLMNPITADRPGRVVEVLVADGEAVEYEQPLIALTTA